MKYLLLALSLFAATAHAGIIRAYDNVIQKTTLGTDWFNDSFSGFDSSLGTLNNVVFGFDYLAGSTIDLTHRNPYASRLLNDTTNRAVAHININSTGLISTDTATYNPSGVEEYLPVDTPRTITYDLDRLRAYTALTDLTPFFDSTVNARIGLGQDFKKTKPIAFEGYTALSDVRITVDYYYTSASVPEPGSLALLSLGLLGFAAKRRFS